MITTRGVGRSVVRSFVRHIYPCTMHTRLASDWTDNQPGRSRVAAIQATLSAASTVSELCCDDPGKGGRPSARLLGYPLVRSRVVREMIAVGTWV